jgi:hypothetical protein
LSDDEKEGVALAADRLINDVITSGMLGVWSQPIDAAKSLKNQSRLKNPFEPPGAASTKAVLQLAQNAMDQQGRVTNRDLLSFFGSIAPGVKQLTDFARNVFDEPLYEAENDVRSLRGSAARWARVAKLDVPKRSSGSERKSETAPAYEEVHESLLVGDSTRAKFLAAKFIDGSPDTAKARTRLRNSVKARQPFRVGPYTSAEHRADFMAWAKSNLPKKDYEQVKRVQDRYEAAAKQAGLW